MWKSVKHEAGSFPLGKPKTFFPKLKISDTINRQSVKYAKQNLNCYFQNWIDSNIKQTRVLLPDFCGKKLSNNDGP